MATLQTLDLYALSLTIMGCKSNTGTPITLSDGNSHGDCVPSSQHLSRGEFESTLGVPVILRCQDKLSHREILIESALDMSVG